MPAENVVKCNLNKSGVGGEPGWGEKRKCVCYTGWIIAGKETSMIKPKASEERIRTGNCQLFLTSNQK